MMSSESYEHDIEFSAVPADLKKLSQWVNWRSEDHGGPKRTKVPYTPQTRQKAKSNDRTTWSAFVAALAAYQRGEFDGLGFVLTEHDEYTGLDLDDCVDPKTGRIEPWAVEIIRAANSYAEISPSGKGVRIFAKGKLPPGGRKKGKVEMYDSGRFLTVTGNHLPGTPDTIEDRQFELEHLHAQIFGAKHHARQTNSTANHKPKKAPQDLTSIREALSHIPAVDYDVWLRGGMALHDAGDENFDLWVAWSRTCPEKFDEDVCHRKWRSFSADKDAGVTLASIIHIAREYGWNDSSNGYHAEEPPPGDSNWSDLKDENEDFGTDKKKVKDVADPWPVLDERALHGLAGDIVRTIDPYTEADRAAVLVTLLVMFGNVINANAHFLVEYTKHFLRLFVALVGKTAKGRKGTSLSTLRYCFQQVDAEWVEKRISGGLSSGEGLIMQVRDPRYGIKDGEEVLIDKGEPDKRFLLIEEEMAGPLKIMTREGNTLSAILRQAWDRGNLRPLTKNNPIRATGAHISIIGHITQEENQRYVTETEQTNGFANRFNWFLVKRSKVIANPRGVPKEHLQPLIKRLQKAVDFARKAALIERDAEAEQLWETVYPSLSEGKPGLFGAVIARAEAQAMRIACLYALLDCSNVVSVVHLNAALALWEYAESSARIIFGDSTGNPTADDILSALRKNPEGLTRTDIRDLFGRNRSASEIDHSLRILFKSGLAKKRSERPRGDDGEEVKGRPIERWFCNRTSNDINDRNDISPPSTADFSR